MMTTDLAEKTPGLTEATLETLLEERAIAALIHHAARLSDEGQFADWMDLFTEDGIYSAITRENAATSGLYLFRDVGRGMLHSRVAFLMGLWQVPRGATRHLVCASEISLTGVETATAKSNFLITRTADLEETELYASGRYDDRFRKVDGCWRFEAREIIIDTNILPAGFTELL